MNKQELITKLELIIDNSKAAVLATVDSAGRPHLRWMTPALLRHHPGSIFTFTAADSEKLFHIHSINTVEWIFQSPSLAEVINISGVINVIDNPALKNELFETLGGKLNAFWNANPQKENFVVLETVIEQALYFVPMKPYRETINFK